MRVEVRIAGDAAVEALPALALVSIGLQVGQSQEQRVSGCSLPLEAASKNFECMLTEMTIENCHPMLLEGTKLGAETW